MLVALMYINLRRILLNYGRFLQKPHIYIKQNIVVLDMETCVLLLCEE